MKTSFVSSVFDTATLVRKQKANAARDEIIRRMEAERDAREAAELAEMKARAEARERQEAKEIAEMEKRIEARKLKKQEEAKREERQRAQMEEARSTLTLTHCPRYPLPCTLHDRTLTLQLCLQP